MSGIRDLSAGHLLEELRVERGLTREELPHAMLRSGVERRLIPSVKTIWRIETLGHVPGVRIQFGLAQFHDRPIYSIWQPKVRRKVTA